MTTTTTVQFQHHPLYFKAWRHKGYSVTDAPTDRSLPPLQKGTFSTAAAQHASEPVLAVVSNVDTKSAIVHFTQYDTEERSVDQSMGDARVDVLSQWSVPSNVYSLDWSPDARLLLAGCRDNLIHLYHTQLAGKDRPVEVSSRAQFVGPSRQRLETTSSSSRSNPPGSYLYTDRIQSVQFQPASASRYFLSTESQSLHIWDVEDTASTSKSKVLVPTASCKVSLNTSLNLPIKAKFSVLDPHLVAVYGEMGITVLDSRTMGVAVTPETRPRSTTPIQWVYETSATGSALGTSLEHAHVNLSMQSGSALTAGRITCLDWNPLVPYWLAAAESAQVSNSNQYFENEAQFRNVVKIWDLRYANNCVGLVGQDGYGYQHQVQSLTWSSSYGDRICTATADGTLSLWSMRSTLHLSSQVSVPNPNGSHAPVKWGKQVKAIGANEMVRYPADHESHSLPKLTSIVDLVCSPLVHHDGRELYLALGSASEIIRFAQPRAQAMEEPDEQYHRYVKELNPREFELETRLYERDIESAMQLVIQYARSSKVAADADSCAKLRALVELCMPYEVSSTWKFAFNEFLEVMQFSSSVSQGSGGGRNARRRGFARPEPTTADVSIYKASLDPVDLMLGYRDAIRFYKNSAMENEGLVNTIPNILSGIQKTISFSTAGSTPSSPRGVDTGAKMMSSHLEKFADELMAMLVKIPSTFKMERSATRVDEQTKKLFGYVLVKVRLMGYLERLKQGAQYENAEDRNTSLSAGNRYSSASLSFLVDARQKQIGSIASLIYQEMLVVIKVIEEEPAFFEISLIRRLVEVVLAWDYLKGLDIGRKLVNMYDKLQTSESNWFYRVGSLCHLLLYPTVYDNEEADAADKRAEDPSKLSSLNTNLSKTQATSNEKLGGKRRFNKRGEATSPISEEMDPVGHTEFSISSSLESLAANEHEVSIPRKSALESVLRNNSVVAAMISAEYRVQKLLYSYTRIKPTGENNDESTDARKQSILKVSDEIIQVMAGQKTISVSSNRALLNSYLLTGRYDEYFTQAFEFVTGYSTYDFSRSVARHIAKIAIPKFRQHLDHVQAQTSTRDEATGHDQWKSGLLQVIKMMFFVVKYQGQFSITGSASSISKSADGREDAIKVFQNFAQLVMYRLKPLGESYTQWIENIKRDKGSKLATTLRSDVDTISKAITESVQYHQARGMSTSMTSLDGSDQPVAPPRRDFNKSANKQDAVNQQWTATFVISETTAITEALRKWMASS